MKQKEIHIDINTAMAMCIRAGIKVYPIVSGHRFKVQLDDNGSIQTYDKEFTSNAVANAVTKTYKWYAKRLKLQADAKKP